MRKRETHEKIRERTGAVYGSGGETRGEEGRCEGEGETKEYERWERDSEWGNEKGREGGGVHKERGDREKGKRGRGGKEDKIERTEYFTGPSAPTWLYFADVILRNGQEER